MTQQVQTIDSLVSIIIPCFNGQDCIADAIQSALNQTHVDREVIVVDDGSTDGSLAIIRGFGPDVTWLTGKNSGGGAARNRGLAIARGQWIQFLDADDVLHDNRVQVMLDAANRCDSRTVPVSGWISLAEGKDVEQMISLDDLSADPVVFCTQSQMATMSPLHRRELLTQVGGFREELPCSQERDLHLRLACVGVRWHRVPEALFTVRRRKGSVSANLVKVLDQHADIFMRALGLMKESGTLTKAREAAIARVLCGDARQYVRCGEFERAKRYFGLARSISVHGTTSGFGRWQSRLLCQMFGPLAAERLIQFITYRRIW